MVLQWLPKVYQWVQEHGGEPIIPFSGIMESKLFDMPDDEKGVYCKEVCYLSDCSDFAPPDSSAVSASSILPSQRLFCELASFAGA
jgi:hypothetical protein